MLVCMNLLSIVVLHDKDWWVLTGRLHIRHAPLQIGAVPRSLSWGPSPRLMVTVCGDGSAFVCRKALLHHKVSEGMAAVQVRGIAAT